MGRPKKGHNPNEKGQLSAADIAGLLGVSERSVSNYIKDKHLPCHDERQGRRFVWSEVLEWYVQMRTEEAGKAGNRHLKSAEDETTAPKGEIEQPEQREEFKEALRRRTVAEADLKELELATRRGEVVAIGDVQRKVENLANALRTKIQGWPTLMLGRVYGMKDRNQLFALLTRSANDLCRDLITVDTKTADAQ